MNLNPSDFFLENGYAAERNPLSSELQNKLYQLIEILETVISTGKSVISNIPVNHFKEPMFIRVNFFNRYINRIEVLIPLLKQWKKNINVEDSIGIIIRSCLVDVISQFYLEEFHSKVKVCPSEEEDKYLQVARDLLADHIFTGVKYFKTLKDVSVFTNSYYKKSIDEWKRLYPPYFKNEAIDYDKPTQNIAANPFPLPLQILKEIRNSDLLKRQNPDQIYMSYFFYSKYEHFGVTTNSLQTKDINMSFYFMMDSLTYILFGSWLCCAHFVHADAKLKEDSEKIYSLREEFVRIVNDNHPTDADLINNNL